MELTEGQNELLHRLEALFESNVTGQILLNAQDYIMSQYDDGDVAAVQDFAWRVAMGGHLS